MIFVFKTSVRTKLQAKQLMPHLNRLLPLAKWNFDLEDCDKILRVESEEDISATIIKLLRIHGHSCEELL